MKIKSCLIICLAALPLLGAAYPGKSIPYISRYVKNYTSAQKRDVLEMVNPSPVMADIMYVTELYLDREGEIPSGSLGAGVSVEVLEDYSAWRYRVRENLTGTTGWVDGAALAFPADTPANKILMTDAEVEAYVNISGFESDTEYLIFTDIDRQLTYVLEGRKYRFRLLKTFECATGKNRTPTMRGDFAILNRGEWFYSERLSSGAMYWMRFCGNYLYHSLPMNAEREVMEHTLGERISSGCIRLSVEDAEWMYLNVPDGSAAYIT